MHLTFWNVCLSPRPNCIPTAYGMLIRWNVVSRKDVKFKSVF